MLRNLVKDTATYAIPTLLTRGIGLLLLPVYTHFLRPEEYGLLELLAVVTVLAGMIIPLEITQAIVRLLPSLSDHNDRSRLSSTAFWFVSFMLAAIFLPGFAFPDQYGRIVLPGNENTALTRLAILVILSAVLFQIVQSQLRAARMPRAYAISSILMAGISAGGVVYALSVTDSRLSGVLISHTAGYAVATIAAIFLNKSAPVRLNFSSHELGRMLHFSTPLLISSLAVYACLYVDRWLVEMLLGVGALGIYGVGIRLASAITLLLAPLQMALTPLIYEQHEQESTRIALGNLFHLFWTGAMGVVITINLLAPELLSVLVSSEFFPAAKICGWMCLGMVLHSSYLFFPGLWLRKATRTIACINLVGAAVNILLMFVLVPRLNILGAAIAMAASGLMVFLLNERMGRSSYAVRMNVMTIFSTLCLTVGILVMFPGQADTSLPLRTGVLTMSIATMALIGGWHRKLIMLVALFKHSDFKSESNK